MPNSKKRLNEILFRLQQQIKLKLSKHDKDLLTTVHESGHWPLIAPISNTFIPTELAHQSLDERNAYRINVLKIMLALNSDVDFSTDDPRCTLRHVTLLFAAADQNMPDVIQVLVEYGADINKLIKRPDGKFMTALTKAITTQDCGDAARMLVDIHGQSVKHHIAKDNVYDPFYCAISDGSDCPIDVVKKLCRLYDDPSELIFCSEFNKRVPVALLLLLTKLEGILIYYNDDIRSINVNLTCDDTPIYFHTVIEGSLINSLHWAIDHGADLSLTTHKMSKDEDGQPAEVSALRAAISVENVDAVFLIMDNMSEFNVDRAEVDGLFESVIRHLDGVFERFLQKNPGYINAVYRNDSRESSLSLYVASLGTPKMLYILEKFGVDLTQPYYQGEAPYCYSTCHHEAALHGNKETLLYLLQNYGPGDLVEFNVGYSATPLHIAINDDRQECSNIIIDTFQSQLKIQATTSYKISFSVTELAVIWGRTKFLNHLKAKGLLEPCNSRSVPHQFLAVANNKFLVTRLFVEPTSLELVRAAVIAGDLGQLKLYLRLQKDNATQAACQTLQGKDVSWTLATAYQRQFNIVNRLYIFSKLYGESFTDESIDKLLSGVSLLKLACMLNETEIAIELLNHGAAQSINNEMLRTGAISTVPELFFIMGHNDCHLLQEIYLKHRHLLNMQSPLGVPYEALLSQMDFTVMKRIDSEFLCYLIETKLLTDDLDRGDQIWLQETEGVLAKMMPEKAVNPAIITLPPRPVVEEDFLTSRINCIYCDLVEKVKEFRQDRSNALLLENVEYLAMRLCEAILHQVDSFSIEATVASNIRQSIRHPEYQVSETTLMSLLENLSQKDGDDNVITQMRRLSNSPECIEISQALSATSKMNSDHHIASEICLNIERIYEIMAQIDPNSKGLFQPGLMNAIKLYLAKTSSLIKCCDLDSQSQFAETEVKDVLNSIRAYGNMIAHDFDEQLSRDLSKQHCVEFADVNPITLYQFLESSRSQLESVMESIIPVAAARH